MLPSRPLVPLACCILLQVGATTRPAADDPAKRLAATLSHYLLDAHVDSVDFTLNREAEPRLHLDDPQQVNALVKSFTGALAADLHEGKQIHQPTRTVSIRFRIQDGPDVRLTSVGLDMFWAARSDEQPEWKPAWVNLQTPALTHCFAKYLEQIPARAGPKSK
jgi:hypothetical protein